MPIMASLRAGKNISSSWAEPLLGKVALQCFQSGQTPVFSTKAVQAREQVGVFLRLLPPVRRCASDTEICCDGPWLLADSPGSIL